ncbi:MAG: hypothetical protein P1U89_08950 [Verrucomicrobiales bacterium]|nr:hypothetical protein [Verrucomicrobiales bacterium]
MEPFWTTISIPVGETRHWELGPLAFWVRHTKGEWHVASIMTPDRSQDDRWTLAVPSAFPDDLEYERFAFNSQEGDDTLSLKPEFPDRSIISKPLSRVEIPSNSTASFFCRVSLCVKLVAGRENSPRTLTTLALANLSRSWFGTPLEGEACYASSTNAARDHLELQPFPYRVVCPVTIINRSSEPLPFERICIRVNHLKIYQGEQYLWSNEIRVSKSSTFEVSQVTYGSGAPSTEPNAAEIAQARIKVSPGGILLRTFNNLRKTIEIH